MKNIFAQDKEIVRTFYENSCRRPAKQNSGSRK